MLVQGSNGPAVRLRPVRWQFPPDVGAGDDQWLVIDGAVDLGDRSWSFTDPCLLAGEARELAAWLHAVAEGGVEPGGTAAGPDGGSSLEFLEPVLGFSASARVGDDPVVRVHFTAEAAPPWPGEDPRSVGYAVDLQLRADQLRAAADTWTHELDALPRRPSASTD